VAILDQLTGSRVKFGTGIGVHEPEFIRWGVDYYQRAAISEEVLQLVKLAWTQPEVTFEGRMGYDVFCTNHQIGRMRRDLIEQSIELFGHEVIPAFKQATIAAA
jgi:alkanesulfonate monooxygenase SsuD/methylene tetrahydromethanopterin reductase-like flavin-dependent oxidoreductase (luciferase family)